MSYCRWSSDDYQCDVYVWADCEGGYCTEVAGRRRVWNDDVTLPPPVTLPVGAACSRERSAWAFAHGGREATVSALLDDETRWTWLNLPIPDGGRSYWHDTAAECADNLERLKAAGFNVPQYAIDNLREEES